jgi:hypothetical protein
MLFVMDTFTPWIGERLELNTQAYTTEASTPSLNQSSPCVKLKYQSSGLTFWTQAPWWQNPAPDGAPRSVWGLWDYEVLEIFIVGEGGRYLELEIGPYGHYLMLMLHAPREIEHQQLAPDRLECLRTSSELVQESTGSWSSEGLINNEHLPAPYLNEEMTPYWRVNSFWCFNKGAQRYHFCAYPLPGERPDFHQPERFPQWVLS